MAIGSYFRLNYHMIIMAISEVILLMAIGGYFILHYHKLLVAILLMTIDG